MERLPSSMTAFWVQRAYREQAEATRLMQASIPSHLKRYDLVCRYWLADMCSAGEACRFSHLLIPDKVPWCKYALEKVKCPDGKNCLFRHE